MEQTGTWLADVAGNVVADVVLIWLLWSFGQEKFKKLVRDVIRGEPEPEPKVNNLADPSYFTMDQAAIEQLNELCVNLSDVRNISSSAAQELNYSHNEVLLTDRFMKLLIEAQPNAYQLKNAISQIVNGRCEALINSPAGKLENITGITEEIYNLSSKMLEIIISNKDLEVIFLNKEDRNCLSSLRILFLEITNYITDVFIWRDDMKLRLKFVQKY